MKLLQLRRPRRLFAAIRVLALLAFLLFASSICLFHVSKARAGDVLVQIGTQLMRLPDARYPNPVQRLGLNGLDLRLQSGASARPVEQVVQQFREACQSRAALQLDARQRAGLRGYLEGSSWLRDVVDGVFVHQSDKGTSVSCIDAGGKPWDLLGVAEAAQRFVDTGELAELGKLRYAWVEPSASGSVFLTVWTEGPTRLLEQFPREGDAPGVDFPELARVPGSQRYLSAQLIESQLAIYRHSEGDLDALAAAYQAGLEAAGYASIGKPTRGEGTASYSLEKGRRHVLMTLSKGRQRSVMVSLLSQP